MKYLKLFPLLFILQGCFQSDENSSAWNKWSEKSAKDYELEEKRNSKPKSVYETNLGISEPWNHKKPGPILHSFSFCSPSCGKKEYYFYKREGTKFTKAFLFDEDFRPKSFIKENCTMQLHFSSLSTEAALVHVFRKYKNYCAIRIESDCDFEIWFGCEGRMFSTDYTNTLKGQWIILRHGIEFYDGPKGKVVEFPFEYIDDTQIFIEEVRNMPNNQWIKLRIKNSYCGIIRDNPETKYIWIKHYDQNYQPWFEFNERGC